MSTEANKTLSLGESIFKKLVWDKAVDAGLASMFASNPWLAAWPFGPLVKALTDKFSEYVFNSTTLFVDVTDIKLSNKEHQDTFIKSSITLSIIAHDKGVQSDEYKTALKNAMDAMSKFTRFGL